MPMICSTCLSTDRKLVPLNKLKNDISINCEYFMINEEITNLICWECEAVFKGIQRFRMQTMKARDFLQSNNFNNSYKMDTKCLSQLNSCTKNIYDAIWACADATNVDESTQSVQNSYLYVGVSDIDDDFKDEPDTSQIFPRIVYCVGSATNIDNNATYDDDHNIDNNVVNINTNNCSNVNEHSPRTNANIQTKPGPSNKNTCTQKSEVKLTKDESRFLVTVMSEEEMRETRRMDRNRPRYIIAPYKCVGCIKAFFDQARYQKHIRNNHFERAGKHKCTICGIFTTRCDATQQHRAMHYHKYECRICKYKDHRLPTMIIHHQKVHETKLYTCITCTKEFPDRSALRYHTEAVHKENPTCNVCYKSYPKSGFKDHMLSHKKTKVPCPDCGKLYKEISLRTHRKIHTRLTDESAYCAECDIQFKCQMLYKRHLVKSMKHGGDVKYTCDNCEKKFSSKSYLAGHIARMHVQKYAHSCHICEKGFRDKSKLKMHVLEKHEGYTRPKDKLCPYCGKGFKDSSVLTHHIRLHTGERPHQCTHCPAAFTQRGAMIAHCKALHPGLPIPSPKRGL